MDETYENVSVKYECDICEAKSANHDDHIKHLISHAKNVDLCCKKCGREVGSKAALSRHLTVHQNNFVKCNICGIKAKSNAGLARHKMVHYRKNLPSYICSYCDKKFLTKRFFENHLQKHTQMLPFPCKNCDEMFMTKAKLRRHIDQVHLDKAFACRLCQKSFHEKSQLNEHMADHPLLECDLCKKKFYSKQSLKNHMPSHDEARKKFKCHTCECTFLTEGQRDYHYYYSSTHTEKSLNCKVCLKTFSSQCHLNEHMKVHGDFKLYCNMCSQKFVNVASLKRHMRVMHGIYERKPKSTPQCKKCFKVFKNQHEFRLHNHKVHITCAKCSLVFNNEEKYKKHEQHHTANKWFVCGICSKVFKTIHFGNDFVMLWTDNYNFCESCDQEANRKVMLEKCEQSYTDPVDEKDLPEILIPKNPLSDFEINGELFSKSDQSHISYYKLITSEVYQEPGMEDGMEPIPFESVIVNDSSNALEIEEFENVESSEFGNHIEFVDEEENGQTRQILNSLKLGVPMEQKRDLQDLQDVQHWLKNTIRSKEAIVKKEFIKFAGIVDRSFANYDQNLLTVRSYFCVLDDSKQITLENLIKSAWKFKCEKIYKQNVYELVQNGNSIPIMSTFDLKLVSNEVGFKEEPLLDAYPDYISHIIRMFDQFFQALSNQAHLIPELASMGKEKDNFIEMIMRANEKKDVMVVITVRSAKTIIMEILRTWLQSISHNYWNLKSLYYNSICPVKNYTKMVLLYGMNCIDYTIGPIYLIVSPKMLLGASIDEAQLLGDALKQYLATSKSKILFHIGCGYGLTTLMMINYFNTIIGLDHPSYIKQAKKINLLNNSRKIEFIKDEIRNVEKIFEKLEKSTDTMSTIINIDSNCGKSKYVLDNLLQLQNLNYIAIVTSFLENSLPVILKLLKGGNEDSDKGFVPVKARVVDPTPADDNFTVIILMKRRNLVEDTVQYKTEIIDLENEVTFSDNDCVSSISSEDNNSDNEMNR